MSRTTITSLTITVDIKPFRRAWRLANLHAGLAANRAIVALRRGSGHPLIRDDELTDARDLAATYTDLIRATEDA